MHAKIEILMPPTDEVELAVEKTMSMFDENGEDEEGHPNPHTFWDFYVIGGRWSGDKIISKYDKEKLEEFYSLLKENKIMVSGLQCGKQEIVGNNEKLADKLWKDVFPEETGPCPMFRHYNNQYNSSCHYPDVMKLSEISKNLECETFMVHSNSDHESCSYLINTSMWNGCNHVDTVFNGLFSQGLEFFLKIIDNYSDDYKKDNTPTDDWLVVTVDYHS